MAEHAQREFLEQWMGLACEQAARGLQLGEVPVGAVVVRDNRVLGVGFNRCIQSTDPTAHAEIVALRQAASAVGNYRLPGATLFVTVEPCLMCSGAIVHARVQTLVYGAPEPKAGAVRSVMRALDHPALNHRVAVVGDVLADRCRELMQQFFSGKREAARAKP